MKLLIALFTVLFLAVPHKGSANDLTEKEQLVFRQALDSYVQKNDEILSHLLNKNPSEIIGLEVIIAAGSNDAVYSKWGHALLRFVDNDGIWSNDITLNFVALVNTPALSLFKGVTGGYGLMPEVKTLNDFWIQYVQKEDRPLERYIIPSSPFLIANLFSTLKQWKSNPSQMGRYKFLGNNCVGALSKLLSVSGFIPSGQKKAVIPTHFSSKLDMLLLSPFEKLTVKSPFYILPKAIKALDLSAKNFLLGNNWPKDSSERLFSQFTNDELMFIYQSIPLIPLDVSSDILASYKKSNSLSFSSFLGFAVLPNALYELCLDQDCAAKILKNEQRVWGKVDTGIRRSKRINSFFRFDNSSSLLDSDLYASYKNLIDAQLSLNDFTILFTDTKFYLSSEEKIEIELKYNGSSLFLVASILGENSDKFVLADEKVSPSLLRVVNLDEVSYKGIVIGKITKKNLSRDVVKFNSPYSLSYQSYKDGGISIGLIAPSL